MMIKRNERNVLSYEMCRFSLSGEEGSESRPNLHNS